MKNILFILLFSIVLIFQGCEKDISTMDESRVTYFPEFKMEGETEIFHIVGTPYVDEEVSASEDGVDLPLTITVSGETTGYSGTEVDYNTADKYVISYVAYNSDGFPGSVTRTVYVVPENGDFINDISGLYYSNSQRAPDFAFLDQYSDMEYVYVIKTGENTYSLGCAIGAYYYLGRGYGFNYAAQGSIITANNMSANDFSVSGANIPGFGLDIEVSGFAIDPSTKTISYTGIGDFGNGTFNVQLVQKQY